MYGSRWLTAGMGSVFMLWGDPGDLVVEFTHLKQPAEAIGPWKLLHDHLEHGLTTVLEQVDLLGLVAASGGLTAEAAALTLYAASDRNSIEKARRAARQARRTRLDREVRRAGAWSRSATAQKRPRESREYQRAYIHAIHSVSCPARAQPSIHARFFWHQVFTRPYKEIQGHSIRERRELLLAPAARPRRPARRRREARGVTGELEPTAVLAPAEQARLAELEQRVDEAESAAPAARTTGWP